MLTPYLPYPPVSGGRMRTYNLCKCLSRDFGITLVSFGRPEERALDCTPMSRFCEDFVVVHRDSSPTIAQAALMSLTSRKPITARLYHNDEMAQKLMRIIDRQKPDVVHVESFYMLQNLPRGHRVPVLLSEPAIEYLAWARHARLAQPIHTRPGIALEALKMRLVEPRAWESVDLVGAMSQTDAEIISKAAPKAAVTLTPNGVDVEYFKVNLAVERDNVTAVYMGDYKYFPNTDAITYFAREILPLVRERKPHFRLTLLGKDPSPELLALQSDNVTVAGLVDDTRPYLQSSAMFICPLRSGGGTRFKLMEALACGCPVVSTSLGCEGLGAVDGEQMLIRDTPQDFANAMIDLMDSPQEGERIGTAGRAWVEQRHAWEQSAKLLESAYHRLIGTAS